MIEIELVDGQTIETTFGYLHVTHEYPNVVIRGAQDGEDRTRTERGDLTEQEQDSLASQTVPGEITLSNPAESGVRLSNIQVLMDVDELDRSMDYDVSLVDPADGRLNVDVAQLDPGQETSVAYHWMITNKFGEIGENFRVAFAIRPSYSVTALAVDQGTQRNNSQDIGVAEVSVEA